MKFYDNTVEEVLDHFKTSESGKSSIEASELLKVNGKNELPKKKQASIFKIFISQFENPIELILVFTVILSFIIGETTDAIALVFIIAVDVIMGTYEEWKAEKDAMSLMNMIKVSSKVIRDGKEIVVDSSELVVGDIILLESGDKISSDARIIECHNFSVDESPLTGESINITKTDEVLDSNTVLAERRNMVYAGTNVITGRAKAIVVTTGVYTEIGKIAEKVINTEEEKSPLTIRIEKFSKQISVLIILVAILTTLVLLGRNYLIADIILCVIALSVSAMPEGLPLALTMALTIASKRMLKKNVIVKKLNSVESLGSCTVICSDKTGTLTVNEQTAKEIVLANGNKYNVTGTGYNGNGKIEPMGDYSLNDVKELVMLGALNNEAHLEYKNKKWSSFGDSIDIAFLALAKKIDIEKLPSVEASIPYESENQFSAVYYKKNGKLYCTVKGSLEKIMSFSEDKKSYREQNIDLTGQGYRVIALANGEVKSTDIKDLKKLDFIGMVAFIDPIREEVLDSIKECSSAGIKVVMVTGDHPLTAFKIAKDLGLCTNYDEVATGRDVEKYRSMGEEKFDEYVSNIRVFSRVTPLDKLDIVNSYKRQGEFVAVTGDGVNDAPAIKAANIGVAMGSGTDVAKETASMIIADDNFTSIVEGIKEGRTAYSNIRKITLFLLGCGLAEVAFFLLSIAFGYDIPLVAIQLLWLNVVTDGLQDISLSFERSDEDIMREKPRSTKEGLFSKDLIIEILILGVTITSIVFGVWHIMMKSNTDIVVARSVIMMLMVFIQNIGVLSCRNEKKSVFKTSILSNPLLLVTIVGSIGMQLVLSEIPFTAKFLNVVPLSAINILQILGLSFIIILVYEVYVVIYDIVHKKY